MLPPDKASLVSLIIKIISILELVGISLIFVILACYYFLFF